jgi:hypothetical protein
MLDQHIKLSKMNNIGVQSIFIITIPFFDYKTQGFCFCYLPNIKSKCRNPSLGLATKARVYKVVNQEGSPGVTPHALENVGKCEGMNPHTSKGASTLGVGVLVDF